MRKYYIGLFLLALITGALFYFAYYYENADSTHHSFLKHLNALAKNSNSIEVIQEPAPKSSVLVNELVLKKKIERGLPRWAMAQIEEDLSKFPIIRQSDLDKYLQDYDNPHNLLVRFQIKNGRIKTISRNTAKPITRIWTKIKGTKKIYKVMDQDPSYAIIYDLVQYLAKNHYIPDTDFILGLYDYLVIPSQKPIPIFTFSKDLAVTGEKDLILIPDWMNLRSVQELSLRIRKANQSYSWVAKEKKLFWRGGAFDSTGFRRKLVNFSKLHPNLIDARFVDSQGIGFVEPEEHLKYRYLIAIDGLHCTWERLIWHLHSNSLVFKNQSTQVQWFYKGIQPYEHFIPVENEDVILEKIIWAEENPEQIQSIISKASLFVSENLELEDMYHYYIVLLQEYSKRLKAS